MLGSLIDHRRVILCVGCGGVGKTTVTASLGLAAALRGRRVLCLTIDPARRLASALGLERVETEAQPIDPALFHRAGLEVPGTLTVMMLDPKRTFDELVARHAPSPAVRDRILANPIYGQLSARLAGTQEYMAMEKLLAVRADPAYDLVVLDTPPTSNALDFLDAPERLIGMLDSTMARWLVQAFAVRRGFRLNLVAEGAAVALRGIARLVGSGFVQQVAEFLTELDSLFGGFKQRAKAVADAFRGEDFAYVLVTSPEPASLAEVRYFAERLAALGMRRDAFVVNRVQSAPATTERSSVAALASELGVTDPRSAESFAERSARAAADEATRATLDAGHLSVLDELPLRPHEPRPLRVIVRALAGDVHDLTTLATIARQLV